ncbi:DUF1735 domain-containing protein [Saccharicrinis sp. GN24d3]|uniref:DUF1735 domain-containing protein n=1 Tax=Saccharicrinis sp. GN24d3 TaxID=3458416 RepID=UPI00403522EC
MKIYKLIFASFLVLSLMASCEKYEDYVNDFDYTTVYFGTQKPLRTIVAYDEMEFEVGVALGGMRDDNGTHSVSFEVDENLLVDIPEAAGFQLLPEEYYTLGDESNFNIIKDHMRTVNVSLNKEAFTADPLSVTNTYALPLRITSASVDSIPGSELETATIDSRDITIVVVKYISPYHGTYYSKGVQYELDGTGAHVDTVTFTNENLSQNMTKEFTTLALNTISTNTISANTNGQIDLTIGDDNAVEIATSVVAVSDNNSVYNADDKTIYMDYKFEKSGTMYHTLDTLILRQAPELDLRFEEW